MQHTAVRAIGAGFQSVLFADPRSVAEVEQCVRCVRTERPQSGGMHGVNMHRAAMQDAGNEAWADAMDKVVIALMIEKKEAIENLEAMLAVPGVDMVQFGPADYSNSIGLTGQFTHPKVKEAEQYVIKTALSNGHRCTSRTESAARFRAVFRTWRQALQRRRRRENAVRLVL